MFRPPSLSPSIPLFLSSSLPLFLSLLPLSLSSSLFHSLSLPLSHSLSLSSSLPLPPTPLSLPLPPTPLSLSSTPSPSLSLFPTPPLSLPPPHSIPLSLSLPHSLSLSPPPSLPPSLSTPHSIPLSLSLPFIYKLSTRWQGSDVNEIGLDKATGKVRVKINSKYYRPTEVVSLQKLIYYLYICRFKLTFGSQTFILFLNTIDVAIDSIATFILLQILQFIIKDLCLQEYLQGDSSKAKKQLNWTPKYKFEASSSKHPYLITYLTTYLIILTILSLCILKTFKYFHKFTN